MSIVGRIFGPSTSVGSDSGWLFRAFSGPTNAGINVSEHSAMGFSAIFACVRILSNTIAMLPLNVHRRIGEREEVARDHPVQKLLRKQANKHMTSHVFKGTVQGHMARWGNGYAEIERNGAGKPVGLWPLLPDRTYPEIKQDGELFYRSNIAGQTVTIPSANTLHMPLLPFDGYLGQSPIALHRQGIGLALAAEEFGSKFFSNGASGGIVLEHPTKLSDTAYSRIRESFQEANAGLSNAHRVKVLEEGMKFNQMTIPPEDAQFLQTRVFQVEEAARIYGMPLILLQSHEKTTSWGTGIEQLMIGFVVHTMQPWIDLWEAEINRKLFSEDEQEEYFVKFNLNALLRGDAKSRAEYYGKGIQDGWLKRNEARMLEDLNPEPGADDLLYPLNMAKAGEEPQK